MKSLACMAVVVALLTTGCGRSESGRIDVHGHVTWKGAPVPSGYVVINPDSSQGNKGPQGMAMIVDGKFDTRDGEGRGGVAGPVTLSVRGYDGINPSADAPFGGFLFGPYETSIEIPATGGQVDIEVPAS